MRISILLTRCKYPNFYQHLHFRGQIPPCHPRAVQKNMTNDSLRHRNSSVIDFPLPFTRPIDSPPLLLFFFRVRRCSSKRRALSEEEQ
ncbi:hypothetical protein CEXT_544231 [Caerostris extrusa]|uniref:Uncharacterized protein n=1 Tax=Caerostris extrusa TaxID=172846 RepID=A0AAV4QD86_CAEEX|nr:hypothetical protein CEXT_544231 [Caerostris extrusa]